MEKIKLFVMDVDGTLTDGKISLGPQGELFKVFDIKDGYAIHEMLPTYGIKTAIITGRMSEIVLIRGDELEVDFIFQAVKKKYEKLKDLVKTLEISLKETAYMGDDIIDLESIQNCGVSGCPSDAVQEIKDSCSYICKKKGGDGAVREFVEWIVKTGRV